MKGKSYSKQLNAKKLFIHIVCIFLVILSLLPFWIMFVNSTRDSASIQSTFTLIPGNYLVTNFKTLQARKSFDIVRGMWNSFQISTVSTFLAVYFSTLTAYGLVVYNYKMRTPAFTFIMVVLMIPTQVSAVGFFKFMYTLGLNNTFIPLMIPAAAAPAVVFFMRQYMLSALPLEIVEAARIDGCSEFSTFNRIAIPMMKPAVATQAIFLFITSWNRFFEPSMILSSQSKYTLPLLVQILKGDRFKTDYGTIYLALSMMTLPLFVVYFLMSKHIIRGVAMGGVKE